MSPSRSPLPLPVSPWRIAALPATGGALALWLFMSRLAHGGEPSPNWWFGFGLALVLGGIGCLQRPAHGGRLRGGRFWGGLFAPAVAGAALWLALAPSITMALAVLACVGGAAAVLDWAAQGPRPLAVGTVDAMAAGAATLAGLVPAAAAPVIGGIAGVLLGIALGIRLIAGPRRPASILLVGLVPLALLAQGLAWPEASLAWLAGPVCLVGLLVEANRAASPV
ncbi:MAG: hypothetical protein WCZ28_15690 [Burkholderiaceae bacterium]